MKFSIIHPSRNRSKMAYSTKCKWTKHLSFKNNYEYILSIDKDDVQKQEYKALMDNRNDILLCSNNTSAVDAINKAAQQATGDIIIVISDDFDCFPNWDLTLSNKLEKESNYLLKTYDYIQEWIVTLPIMDKEYYNRFGYVYYPEYKHMFCDTELTHIADITGRLITDLNIKFKHNHYTQVSNDKDNISEKADSTWKQGKELYIKRCKECFGLMPDEIKNKLKYKPHIEWLKKECY